MTKLINNYTHHTITEDGVVTNTKTGNVKSIWISKIGYACVDIQENGKAKKHYLHRLLAQHFIPNPENKPEVNHIDGNKQNYSLSNLEWVTSSENVKHAHDTGLQPYKCNYSLQEYETFFAQVMSGTSLTELASTVNQSLAQLSIHVKRAAERLGKTEEYKKELLRQKSIAQQNANRPTYKVNMINMTTDVIENTFESLKEAAKYLNKTSSGPISNVLAGRQKSAYGYFWERV